MHVHGYILEEEFDNVRTYIRTYTELGVHIPSSVLFIRIRSTFSNARYTFVSECVCHFGT